MFFFSYFLCYSVTFVIDFYSVECYRDSGYQGENTIIMHDNVFFPIFLCYSVTFVIDFYSVQYYKNSGYQGENTIIMHDITLCIVGGRTFIKDASLTRSAKMVVMEIQSKFCATSRADGQRMFIKN